MYYDTSRMYYMLISHNSANKTNLINTIYRCSSNQLVYQPVEHHMADECSFFEELLIGRYMLLDLFYLSYLVYSSTRIEHQHSSNTFLILAAHLIFPSSLATENPISASGAVYPSLLPLRRSTRRMIHPFHF